MKNTRSITVGGVQIGGGAPVAVQSMTKTATEDVKATVAQILALEAAGCEIIRVAIPHKKALTAIPSIKQKINIPLIADVHFKKELAIGALESGADAVRVNPGNLGGKKNFTEVIKKAAEMNKAVRIGVNYGSLEEDIATRKNLGAADKLVASAIRYVEIADKLKLKNFKVSLKASDIPSAVEANRKFSSLCDAPLHIGITEAGDIFSGAIRSAAGLAILLNEGIGDTIRVSLTAPPEREVEAAWEILRSLEIRRRGVEIISCPTCGRCAADTESIVAELKMRLSTLTTPLKVAVMGCEVNGPGEAASADIGVALNRTEGGVLFVKGMRIKKIAKGKIVDSLEDEIRRLT